MNGYVITDVDEPLKNFFYASCEVLGYSKAQAFSGMLRPFLEGVLRELELHPEADTAAIDAIHDQLETLLPMARVKPGGYVGQS